MPTQHRQGGTLERTSAHHQDGNPDVAGALKRSENSMSDTASTPIVQAEWEFDPSTGDLYEVESNRPIALVRLSASNPKESYRWGHLIRSAPRMAAAMLEFVERCDRGEVKSIYTYELFKEILHNNEVLP